MFYGQHRHGIDEKGRLIFPSKYRDDLGEFFYITRGTDRFLMVFTQDEWSKLEQKISSLPISTGGDIQRFFFNNTEKVSFDKQGRVLIPSHLRQYAELDKDVVISGSSTRIEIWNAEKYDKLHGINVDNSADMSAQMELLGI